ncbi:MAG: hypothetical protein V4717_09315 [Bacteroidota bacterium]
MKKVSFTMFIFIFPVLAFVGLAQNVGIGTTSPSDKLTVFQDGTSGAGRFVNSNAAALKSALYGESNHASNSTLVAGVEGRSVNGFGMIGHGGPTSVGIFGAVITTETGGAFFGGTGISGFSDIGNGTVGVTYHAASAGVYGTATGTGTGVKGTSTLGIAARFENTNNANSSNVLQAETNGTGIPLFGKSTATTGPISGVYGETNSTSFGIGASGGVSGVFGKVATVSAGGYSAGVRGVNSSTGGSGIGVIGYQAGSGWGVYGETPSGFGVYGLTTNNTGVSTGVRGETFSINGTAVEAKYSGAGVGVALEIDNGVIKVTGPIKPAFVHTATLANKLSLNGTVIDNLITNNCPTCILIVTQRLNPSGIIYNNSPIGTYYNTIRDKWEIFNENNTAIPTNAQFSVLVITQ